MRIKLFFLVSIFLVFGAMPVLARLGVGVATGKIVVDQLLYPGQIYYLPPLTVLNTGDEESLYSVNVAYHEAQAELRPDREWFAFEPAEFQLAPGQAQAVTIKLNLPVKTVPGNYFAYLEGSPAKKSTNGQTSVGVAAAAKLYFQVLPANIWMGIYYRVISFWQLNQPWTSVAAGVVIFSLLIGILRRNFSFNIVKKSKSDTNE